MLRLVVFCLLGACLPLTLAFPSNNAAVTTSTPVPTKYAACKTSDCPPFRVVERFSTKPDVELREYSESFWLSAEAQGDLYGNFCPSFICTLLLVIVRAIMHLNI